MSVPANPWYCTGQGGPGPIHCCIHEKRMREGMAYGCCYCNNSAGPGEPHPPFPDLKPADFRQGPLWKGYPPRPK